MAVKTNVINCITIDLCIYIYLRWMQQIFCETFKFVCKTLTWVNMSHALHDSARPMKQMMALFIIPHGWAQCDPAVTHPPPSLRLYDLTPFSSFCNRRARQRWPSSLGRHSHPRWETVKSDQWETIRQRLRVRDRQTMVWWCENQSACEWTKRAICDLERSQNVK